MLEIFRHIHMTCAVISIVGFISRGIGMMLESAWLQNKAVRILPHIVDTILLLSAIGMLSIYGFSLATQGWLIAKIIGLIAYIIIGTIALKRGKTKTIRVVAFFVAIIVFAYIITTAHSKTPWMF